MGEGMSLNISVHHLVLVDLHIGVSTHHTHGAIVGVEIHILPQSLSIETQRQKGLQHLGGIGPTPIHNCKYNPHTQKKRKKQTLESAFRAWTTSSSSEAAQGRHSCKWVKQQQDTTNKAIHNKGTNSLWVECVHMRHTHAHIRDMDHKYNHVETHIVHWDRTVDHKTILKTLKVILQVRFC